MLKRQKERLREGIAAKPADFGLFFGCLELYFT
jgi:hypothetical protein